MSVVAARPVLEQIAQELYARLRVLASGYSASTYVSEVIRPVARDGYTPRHLQIVITQQAPQRNPDLSCPGNPPAQAWDVQFDIRCHINPSERDTTPVDEYANTMAADVIKAVCDEDYHGMSDAWHTFGNLSLNAQWQTPETIDAGGGFEGINVPLVVTYRTDEDNPYNKR